MSRIKIDDWLKIMSDHRSVEIWDNLNIPLAGNIHNFFALAHAVTGLLCLTFISSLRITWIGSKISFYPLLWIVLSVKCSLLWSDLWTFTAYIIISIIYIPVGYFISLNKVNLQSFCNSVHVYDPVSKNVLIYKLCSFIM